MAARAGGAGADWLSRALARAGVLPLDDAERAIVNGAVAVDGRVVKEPLAPVQVGKTRVTFDGHPVSLDWRTRVVMLHKPAGVAAHGKGETVFDVLRAALPVELQRYGWHAVGRLDKDTTGLLLFTNDEKLVAHVTAPATKLPKRYVAQVAGQVTEEKLAALRRGVKIDEGPLTRPAKATARDARTVELVLTEGRFHQVKRMLNAVGLATLVLHREAVGTLELDVPLGELRELTDIEVSGKLGFS